MLRWQYPSRFEPLSPFGENITVDKYYQPLSQPRFDKIRSQHYYPYSFWNSETPVVAETITVDKWFSPFSQPVYAKKGWIYPYLSYDSDILTKAELITLDKWHSPLSQPRFDRQRRQYQNPMAFWNSETPISAESLIAMKSLVIDIGDMGMTLMPQGNTLPISIVTQAPTAAPPGNKGVCFRISGGVLTIYAWNLNTSSWIAN